MEMETNAGDLLQAVKRASLVVERKAENQLLTNIKLEGFASTGVIRITGSSLVLNAGCRIDGTVSENAHVCVDQQRLLDIASVLRSGKNVKMKLVKDGFQIRQGSSRFTLPFFDASEFPKAPKPGKAETISITVDKLLTMIRAVEGAMLNDEQRAHLSGAGFEWDGAKAMMVATDSRRLHKIEAAFETDSSGFVFIPHKALITLRKFCETIEPQSTINLAATETHLFFHNALAGFSCKLIETKKMDYAKVVPAKSAVKMTMLRSKLVDALSRVKVVSDDPVRLYADADTGKLEITHTGSDGSAREMFKCDIKGTGETVLSVTHLLDYLGTIATAERVTFRFDGYKAPAVLAPAKGSGRLAVMMPLVGYE